MSSDSVSWSWRCSYGWQSRRHKRLHRSRLPRPNGPFSCLYAKMTPFEAAHGVEGQRLIADTLTFHMATNDRSSDDRL